MKITVRKYKAKDRSAVLLITERSFPGFCMDENIEKQFGRINGTGWQQRKTGSIEYDLDTNPEHTFVAEVAGELVGFICARLHRSYSIGHIANLAVAPEFQSCGVGKALLGAALRHFRKNGIKYARLETMTNNSRAQNFYASVGFQEIGRQVFYFTEL